MTTIKLITIPVVVFLGILAVVSFGFKVEYEPEPQPDFVDKFVNLGCDILAIEHIAKYSNLLDEDFEGNYVIAAIGLPDNLSQKTLDKCVKIIIDYKQKNET